MILPVLLFAFTWAQVQTGLDRLAAGRFAPLQGKTIGVLTHAAAVDREGRHITQVLADGEGFHIKAWFSPEHGFESKLDQATIPDQKEAVSGAIIYSLYGKTRKPTPAMLEGIDLMLLDVQDVGVRFYTYQTTLLYAMEACAAAGVDMLVLDRPNPIGGTRCEGPMLDADRLSFVGRFPMPLIHGMTMGEIARMFQAENKIAIEPRVQKMAGWRRDMLFEETGLPWVNPSPNMRNPNQALLYPAIGLLETTNLSVGRGTDTPFERLGAPWIEPVSLCAKLNAARLPGVRFVPHFFTPESGPYHGQRCGGLQILLRDPRGFDPITTGYRLFQTLRLEYAKDYETGGLIRLLGNQKTLEMLMTGVPIAEIRMKERQELKAFRSLRKRYLSY